ncbi:MAG: hypothetical protein HQL30_12200, partial [Candidatus Omnitrophica bacterium]|nr:hypothetical protein [Candidatus Omnitrophota bacterium]
MKTNKKDPLLAEIEDVLDFGRYVSYGAGWDFVSGLERVKTRLDGLVKEGLYARAVGLYELFIAGCYEKIEDVDDSGGNFGAFFENLFLAWVVARQKAGLDPEETVNQILKMVDNDEYGVCYGIEKMLPSVLGEKEGHCFETIIMSRFEKSIQEEKPGNKTVYDFSGDSRHNADILKAIYRACDKTDKYILLCEKMGMTPSDCESLTEIYMGKKLYEKAIYFADKGLALEKERDWHNYCGHGLSGHRRKLLSLLGRKDEVLESVWREYKEDPSEYRYDELMKYVPGKEKRSWHDKALLEAREACLHGGVIELLVKMKEFDVIVARIDAASLTELESLGHYALAAVAKALSRGHWKAS